MADTEKKMEPAAHKQHTGYNPLVQEPAILAFWQKKKILEKARKKNVGKPKFYFLDGPPYTSGRVHIGTAWNKALKDMVVRYKRMQGFDTWDRAGYDMHGLPTEHGVQKKLGLRTKEDILKFGEEKFIQECRKFSLENLKTMNQDFIRLGVWLDFDNAYQSIDPAFIEGVWWMVKKAHEQGRLYEGLRTIHWCSHCATALAKHELEYKTVKDNSIFLKFKVKGKKEEYLIIWTTTPWTIPLNLGIMVHPDMEYVKCRVEHETWIVAKALANIFISAVAGKKFEIIEEMKGEQLKGVGYEHPLHELDGQYQKLKQQSPAMHTVLLSEEYVDTSSGSGLVHCAPGCGPEDYEVGHRNGIAPWNPIDQYGVFPADMGQFTGMTARKDDAKIIEALRSHGCVVGESEVEHEYPHCQRCHNPVIFRTTKQWFFKVEDLKEKMIAENRKIKWMPDAAFNAFDSWLSNLRDNSITKQRYWGTPVPVWRCEKCGKVEVFDSIKELEKRSGKKIKDPHKPWIDEVMIPCSCKGTMKRLPDVLDVWVDAGCAAWTCLDYPQKKELFKNLFPADFILEGKDQIRGWFNLLMIASMLAIGKPSFKSVYMHGFVQDALGRKMSKSLGNYILPEEVIGKYGADTLRYYMIGGALPGLDLNYNFKDMEQKHKNLTILWNLHKFLIDLSKTIGMRPDEIDTRLIRNVFSVEEKYMSSVLHSTIERVTRMFEELRMNEVPDAIEHLLLELSRTYIQLIREKAAIGEDLEKQAVLYTVNAVLLECLKMLAVVCPFISEQIYLNLKEAFGWKKESVHLLDWPKPDLKQIDQGLEKEMEIAQGVIQAVLSGREKIQLGVRWPLKQVLVVCTTPDTVKAIEALEDLIKVQTNVKDVSVVEKFSQAKLSVRADFAQLGPDFGESAPKIIAKLAMDSPETILGHIEREGFYEIQVNGKSAKIVKEHLIVTRDVPYPYHEVESRAGLVYLNQERSEELEAEGYAREVMRRIQQARKEAGLEKVDAINLSIQADEDLQSMLKRFESLIKEKTGARTLKMGKTAAKKYWFETDAAVKKQKFRIGIEKV